MNPLLDIVSPRARKYFYAAVALLSLADAVWELAQHNWAAVLPAVVSIASGSLAHANTNPVDPQALPTPSSPAPTTQEGAPEEGK
jgi:glucose dehydrogenase